MIERMFLIGLGHRARHGKDTVSRFISELRDDVHVIHFADALYEEVKNPLRRYPLITRDKFKLGYAYNLLDDVETDESVSFLQDEVPFLHKIFEERGINWYEGMDKKDPPILQFWGTQFRRKQDENHWIKQTEKKLHQLMSAYESSKEPQRLYVCIADTRFKNEVEFVNSFQYNGKSCGYYVKVVRLNPDGTQYLDPSRDPNHQSEADLNDVEPVSTLYAESGDLRTLQEGTVKLLLTLESKYEITVH